MEELRNYAENFQNIVIPRAREVENTEGTWTMLEDSRGIPLDDFLRALPNNHPLGDEIIKEFATSISKLIEEVHKKEPEARFGANPIEINGFSLYEYGGRFDFGVGNVLIDFVNRRFIIIDG